MLLKLNKQPFARNRAREQEIGAFFNQTSSGITNVMPLIIPLFFAPALITTTFFSKEIILMLANVLLSLGYASNFAYRIYQNEVSKAELIIAALLIITLAALAYFFYPPIIAFSFINVLGIVNQIAAGVNLFFLVKDVIIPPCKRLIEKIAHLFGLDITGRYYSKPSFSLNDDRYVLDRLMTQAYGHDTVSPQFSEKKINSFNRLLSKLCAYINKYDESFLGYIFNKEAIAELQSHINQLTTRGNSDSSYAFIHRKIDYKKTKINLLESAKKEVMDALNAPSINAKPLLRFFSNANKEQLNIERKQTLLSGIRCIDKEISRQKEKINSLEACLPSDNPASLTNQSFTMG